MLELFVVSALTLGVLVGAPLLGHIVGWLASRSLRVRPGSIRAWMPSIPDHIEADGRAEDRWEAHRRAVETKLLRKFANGVRGAEAHALAAELGEDPEVLAGALSHMREEIPTRLRVTKGGKLLHDFAAADIATLRNKRRLALPARFAIFSLGVLANLGAAWPVVMGLLVASGALAVIAVAGSVEAVGGTALGIIVALFLANLFAGWVTHTVLTPGLGLGKRPRLGPNAGAEASYVALEAEQAAGWNFFGSGNSRSESSDSGGCSGGSFDLGEGGGAVIIILLLLAVVAACTLALGVFLRGIWRAATGAGMPSLDVSPTQWVRGEQKDDGWESFIPTNDLVIRVIRVLRRQVSHTHPRDSTIVGRIMATARARQGRIAALEIALQEGLDLDEATAVGARLSGRAGGVIDVTDDGEIDFVFPDEALADAPALWDEDMNAEYLDYHPERREQGQTLTRRPQQHPGYLPVNLPGITWTHVKSASRLAAGTVLMMMTGVAVVSLVPGVPLAIKVAVDSFLPLMALGTFALAGALRYITSSLAEIGVRRDIRRMALLQVREGLEQGRDDIDFGPLAGEIVRNVQPAWSGLSRKAVEAEITGLAIDLDLEPASGEAAFSIAELRQRLDALQSYRTEAAEVSFDFVDEGADEVIFDSQIEHDQVRALG